MGFFSSKRKEPPKIFRREAEFKITDAQGNIYTRHVSVSEYLIWAFDSWDVLFGEEVFESDVRAKFHELSKGFIDNDRYVFARDITSIRLVSRTKTEIE